MTTQNDRDLAAEAPLDGVAAIQDWTAGYVNRHPLASLTTVGEQCVLAVRTVQYFFSDLFGGRFQWGEFV
ncbi:MAG: ABC transporter permease, partial [Mycobacterium sp.]